MRRGRGAPGSSTAARAPAPTITMNGITTAMNFRQNDRAILATSEYLLADGAVGVLRPAWRRDAGQLAQRGGQAGDVAFELRDGPRRVGEVVVLAHHQQSHRPVFGGG